jgi:hypothetical protein
MADKGPGNNPVSFLFVLCWCENAKNASVRHLMVVESSYDRHCAEPCPSLQPIRSGICDGCARCGFVLMKGWAVLWIVHRRPIKMVLFQTSSRIGPAPSAIPKHIVETDKIDFELPKSRVGSNSAGVVIG